jgi:hypothetical protein
MTVDNPRRFTHIACDNAECSAERDFDGAFYSQEELRVCAAMWGWVTYRGHFDLCPKCAKAWTPEESD